MRLSVLLILSVFIYSCTEEKEDSGNVESKTVEIVFTNEEGEVIEDISEVKEGKVKFEAGSENKIPEEAQNLHNQARAAGQAGDYDKAVKLLEKAIEIAPDWPYPTYDMAFTYMLKSDYKKALKYYRKTDELAPDGFFTCKTAVWSLEREESGEFPVGTYMAYLSLEWTQEGQKEQLIEAMAKKLPKYIPVLSEMVKTIEDSAEKIKKIDEVIAMSPDKSTLGNLVINKSFALKNMGKKEEAIKLIDDFLKSKDCIKAIELQINGFRKFLEK